MRFSLTTYLPTPRLTLCTLLKLTKSDFQTQTRRLMCVGVVCDSHRFAICVHCDDCQGARVLAERQTIVSLAPVERIKSIETDGLLLARRPPSNKLDVHLHAPHWGISWWRPWYGSARPCTKAPRSPLCSRGRRCTAASNGRVTSNRARTATSVALRSPRTCQSDTC